MSEEELRISQAKYNWNKIRVKKKVIDMIKYSSGEKIQELYEAKYKNQGKAFFIKEDVLEVSKFIIPPNNWWKMQFDNLMILILILYVFLIPLYVSYSSILQKHHLGNLLFFDIMFMASKVVDLFIGYY